MKKRQVTYIAVAATTLLILHGVSLADELDFLGCLLQ